ncbi:3'(2'),5'-bisphosphate nucleotidase CysQ [Shimia abyssi]|uniref:Myo-inositol-1(Or 4)-monophosphatase n=1 Tax=Shimia abyssi TaxID=1662395 RepID=A0A2P8FI10_9RHOB|nr:3'(2'),5'-bisphosphate nucleotidase CysQ [Shimia abyssi]PSL21326.1 myo-inositol-1(or 4)-monophosphatase [Shimia abyssi]
MPETDLDLLLSAAKEAGRIATSFTGPTAQTWHKPENAGPVTEADLAVNEMLERELRAARPDYGWLSEESLDNGDRLSAKSVFIIDPIDGTRSFIDGSDTWAHSLAIAVNGVVTAAVIYLPLRDKLYSATSGSGAYLNGAPIRCATRASLDGANLLVTRPVMEPKHWKSLPPDIKRSYRPSLAYRLALVAEGRYDGMLTLRPTWEWDIAAGDLILREAGATTSNRSDGPLLFNNADPRLKGMVTANADLHRNICSALA